MSLTKYFALGSIFWDEVKHGLGLHDLVEFDNVWMLQQLEDFHLPVNLFQIRLVQLALVDDFDGNLEEGRTKKKKSSLVKAHKQESQIELSKSETNLGA